MTQIFDESGAAVPVTVLDTSNCYIAQVKAKDTDGYNALQVAFGERKPQNVNKALAGHFRKGNFSPRARTCELRFGDTFDMTPYKRGQVLSASMFAKGDRVDIIGTSKGKGFTGVMKRFGFSGKDATHGTSKYFRHGGSSGSNTFPGRVLKNKGMPGHSGNAKATVQNVRVIDVQPESNLILVRGAVPGHRNANVLIQNARKHTPPSDRKLAVN